MISPLPGLMLVASPCTCEGECETPHLSLEWDPGRKPSVLMTRDEARAAAAQRTARSGRTPRSTRRTRQEATYQMRALTPEEIAVARARYLAGMSFSDLCWWLQVPVDALEVLRDPAAPRPLSAPRRPENRAMTEDEILRARRRYLQGASLDDICDELGVTGKHVLTALYGAPRRR